MSDLLDQALAAAGLPEGSVAEAPGPSPESPAPAPDRWTVIPFGAQHVVGATGRGRFAVYEALWDEREAIDLAVRLASTPLPPRAEPLTDDERRAGALTAEAVLLRAAERGGAAGPNELVEGDALDAFGSETEHHLFALGTEFGLRSEPPSRVGSPYFALEVVRALPPVVLEGRAAPWFGQAGGGAMVVLDRPIRWYVDRGFLAPL